jgi:phosphatidylserine decarboxylase
MVKDAFRFIIPLSALAAISAYFQLYSITLILLVLAIFVVYFFRNPARVIPAGENRVVSPADGKVVRILTMPEGSGELAGGHNISIFLNIFNVHVTRAPIRGALEHFEYKRGKFKVAYDEEASSVNEQNILTIRGARICVIVKQIAGLIARRVVCWKLPGQSMERGELFGLIRFGSRVDVLLPREVRVLVKIGERVKGGSSVIGEVL